MQAGVTGDMKKGNRQLFRKSENSACPLFEYTYCLTGQFMPGQ